jgi:hypothetical protein
MAGIATDEIAPGVNIDADDELLDWVRNNAETGRHLQDGCGPDGGSRGRRPSAPAPNRCPLELAAVGPVTGVRDRRRRRATVQPGPPANCN